jgi:dTDP-4-amino-4,6-dideoxygalactose transaminase
VLAGYNCRLDALQAALLGVELPLLQGWLAARAALARAYDAAFAGLEPISCLQGHPAARSAHAVYTLRVKTGRRDELARHLDSRGVGTAVYYRTPLHLQPALAGLRLAPGTFPESERAAAEVLSLPLFPELRPEQQEHVITSVREFFS